MNEKWDFNSKRRPSKIKLLAGAGSMLASQRCPCPELMYVTLCCKGDIA